MLLHTTYSSCPLTNQTNHTKLLYYTLLNTTHHSRVICPFPHSAMSWPTLEKSTTQHCFSRSFIALFLTHSWLVSLLSTLLCFFPSMSFLGFNMSPVILIWSVVLKPNLCSFQFLCAWIWMWGIFVIVAFSFFFFYSLGLIVLSMSFRRKT